MLPVRAVRHLSKVLLTELESIRYALATRQDYNLSPANWSITLIASSDHSLGSGFTGHESLWLVQEIQDWLEARTKPSEA